MQLARASILIALFSVLVACGEEKTATVPAPRPPADVNGQRIINADSEPGNWMSYGRTYNEQRFSPLDKINDTNANQLGLAWYFDLDTHRGQEATPIVVDGVMYVSTAWSKVKALDAKTGKPLWEYDPKVPGEFGIKACCDVVNRGVAVWSGKVYVGTIDGRLIAIDAKTGQPVWDVQTTDRNKPITITGAPRAAKGKVFIGTSGAEFNIRGYISAYDAETGALVWRFYTVPGDPAHPDGAASDKVLEEKARPTWMGDTWKFGGGGTVWDAIVYDPELDLLYFGTDNGDPWTQAYRGKSGDNLFVTSIVAVKPDTGEYVWHYQVNPGDEWDYSAVQGMILTDLTIDGRVRKVLMQAPKNGFFYVLDRATGELLSAKAFAPMNWATGIDMKTGRPIENPAARYSMTGKPFEAFPDGNGAHLWNPMAFSPKTGFVYIPVHLTSLTYTQAQSFGLRAMGANLGMDLLAFGRSDPEIQKIVKGGLGYLLAWDPVNQKEVWHFDYPGPANGGVLATAGNLVFQGSYGGDFAVFHAASGEKLWAAPAQTSVMAAPATYEVDGEQYIAVLAGSGGAIGTHGGPVSLMSGRVRNISRVLVFKLGGTAMLPPMPPEPELALNPPPLRATRATINDGMRRYAENCLICHGGGAISGGVLPDLRYSRFLADDGFFDIVLGGVLKDNGMVSFAPVLNRTQAEAIRAYLISRAQQTKADLAKAAR
jgi:PQQ-dependent dehydrogenase (methanol/ethanol family)